MVVTAGVSPRTDSIDALFNRAPGCHAAVTVTRTSQRDYQTRQLVVSVDGREVRP